VTVVIPTFNRLPDLKRAIASLGDQSIPRHQFEIIVVDNQSTDGTEEWIREFGRSSDIRIRYYRKEPEGPGAARNLGAHEASGGCVIFLDSDVTLDPHWVHDALDFLEKEPDVGMLGGRLVYAHEEDRLNSYGGCLGPIGIAWDDNEGLSVGTAKDPKETLWLSTAAVMVRTSVIREIGGFDATFFYGYEDSDLGWRVNLAGYKVVALPSLTAYHYVGPEIVQSNAKIVFHYSKNRLRSVIKNYSCGRLLRYVPPYLAYSWMDVLVRRFRLAKLKALLWNLRMLPDTLRVRRAVQATRRRSDDELAKLFSRSWFPPTPLAGKRRRPFPEGRDSSPGNKAIARDDRVE